MKVFSHLRKRLTGWLLHPALLALPVAIVSVLFMPQIIYKYRVEPVSQKLMEEDSEITFDDFNSDGWSDYYYTGYFQGKAFATVFNHDEVIDQWNFDGLYIHSRIRAITGDFDCDGIKELFNFNYRNDSLFVTGIRYPQIKEFPVGGRFLALIPNAADQGYTIHSAFLYDLDGDRIKELIVGLTAGYELKPRIALAWNIICDSVFYSPDLGSNITYFEPFEENGSPCIAVSCYASMNYNDSTLFLHDRSVYFMILDNSLKLKFRPIEYKGIHRGTEMLPIKVGDKNLILFMLSGNASDPYYRLRICDTRGSTLHVKEYLQDSKDWFDLNILHSTKGDRVLMVKYNRAELLNEKLEIISTLNKNILGLVRKPCDLDSDGEPEIILYGGNSGKYMICRHDLSHPVPFKLSTPGRIIKLNVVLRGNDDPYFSVQADNMHYILHYSSNQYYFLRYLLWVGIYLTIFSFIMLIRRIQRIQLKRNFETKQKITELKLQSIRNQMDPHFTFNVLNAIGSVILQNKPDESYSMLMKYSRLLRGTINASDKIWRTLEEEITFVKNYLELQKMRYPNVLNYEVNIGDDVNLHSTVPKMVIQTYTENAIRHGILPKEEGGKVSVNVFMENEALVIEISDNGVGRNKAAELHTTSTGKGLEIMRECYKLINELNESPIKEEITDLYQHGSPSGTKVRVEIPVAIAVT